MGGWGRGINASHGTFLVYIHTLSFIDQGIMLSAKNASLIILINGRLVSYVLLIYEEDQRG